jgi:regulator of protease activity HflC (stomatin/prohibitin superfamily)
MPYDQDFSNRNPRRRKPRNMGPDWLSGLFQFGAFSFIVVGLAIAAISWVGLNQFRINVDPGEIAIIMNKVGKPITNGEEVAPSSDYQGIQKGYLNEGVKFVNPYTTSWEVISQEVIDKGEMGIRISLTGDDLPYGEFIAKVDKEGNPTTKGIMPGVLRAGRYPIHPYLYKLLRSEPITVPTGFRGVVTNLSGPISKNPNTLLAEEDFRGVQEKAETEGTYYYNPYEKQISLVDCRSQRFNLSKNKDMGFPSRDGFWISLDGVIEFRVIPEKAAEVFVTYNDVDNGLRIDDEIIRKVIMPNARSFCRIEGSNKLGRDFIQGKTRKEFQEKFQADMREKCDDLGIQIIQAVITKIYPPQKIAAPIREREIAKQEQKQYLSQIEQELSEKEHAIVEKLAEQKSLLVQMDQEVVKIRNIATRDQKIEITKANQQLEVAKLKLEAAENEAAAILSRGKAIAEVIKLKNQAEAAGWKEAVAAFEGNGQEYAQFVLFQKMASAYQNIMINTANSPIMKIFDSFTADLENPQPKKSSVDNSTTKNEGSDPAN